MRRLQTHRFTSSIRRSAAVLSLFLVCLLPAASPAVQIGSHTVDFIAVRYDYPTPGRSTWYYKVTSGGSPCISHVDFELNLECVDVLDAGTWGPSQDNLHSGDGDPVVGHDPSTGVTGIKFDEGFDEEGERRKYYFTLDGNYESALITVAIKAGHSKKTGKVTGPSPVCNEPPQAECVTNPALCNDGNPCTDDSCHPESGCHNINNSNPCDDGQLCTKDDACHSGQCSGTPFLPPACNDSNVCTDNACNPQANGGTGGCVVTNNTAPCNDGLFCTVGDRCSGGQCTTGGSVNCDDGNVCTLDQCDESADACRYQGDASKAGQACNDMNLCTDSDVCNASGGCAGTPKVCNDGDDVCTADSCNPASGCVFTVVVESPQCMSCVDGADNDGDGDIDAEDCNCNLLCETFDYAVVAQRDSTRRTAYFGKDTHAKRGFDPVLGTPGVQAPYPLGASVASACSQGKLELVERAIIDGTGTASTRAEFGDGDQMFLGFFAGFAPPGQVMTTGIPPFVGPRTLCSTTSAPCIDDSQCLPTEKCRPQMNLADPGNPNVDLTGTHPEFADCETAKGSLDVDFATLFALPPTQDLGNIRFRSGDAPIDVTGPGLHVVRLSALRVETGALLPIISDSTTEALIVQIERTLTIGVRARIELVGGLTPDRVLWLVDRRGRAYVGNQEVVAVDDDGATLPGTLLAPQKNIVVGKKARVAGALLGRDVQLNEKAVVSHRPYIAATP